MALRRIRPMAWPLLALSLLALPFTARTAAPAGPRFAVRVAPGLAPGPLDGRLLLLVSKDESRSRASRSATARRRSRSSASTSTAWSPGDAGGVRRGRRSATRSSASRDLPRGHLHGAGAAPPVRDVPPRRRPHGQAARWTAAKASSGTARPGNLYSTPQQGHDRSRGGRARSRIALDKVIPPIPTRRTRSTSSTCGSRASG